MTLSMSLIGLLGILVGLGLLIGLAFRGWSVLLLAPLAALIAAFTPGGTAEMTVSEEAQCPACEKRIPSSCRYCFDCGSKL